MPVVSVCISWLSLKYARKRFPSLKVWVYFQSNLGLEGYLAMEGLGAEFSNIIFKHFNYKGFSVIFWEGYDCDFNVFQAGL